MSEFISGNMSQSVRHDYGDFIRIGSVRVRRETIISYGQLHVLTHSVTDEEEASRLGLVKYGLEVKTVSFTLAIPISNDLEEVKKEVSRLDWIFKGENKE